MSSLRYKEKALIIRKDDQGLIILGPNGSLLPGGPEIIKDFMSGANKGLFLCRSSPLRIMSEASNPHTTGG